MLEKLTSRAAAWWKNFAPRKRGLGLTAVAVSTALIAQGSVVTDASWNDTEWTHGSVGTFDCADPTARLASRAEGRVLSGSLLGINLDDVVEAKGVETTNNGERSVRKPETAPEVGENAYANPLNIQALNNELLDIDLTGVLQLPLNTDTGAINQYAKTNAGANASTDADAVGASGTVANTGAIDFSYYEGDVPGVATLELSTLLNSLDLADLELGTLLEDVTDLELNIGAVAGRASVKSCDEMWGMDGAVTRDYMTSHLDLNITSDVVSSLGTTVSSTVSELETTVNGLSGNDGLLAGVLGNVVGVVGDVLNVVVGGLVGLRVGPDQGLARIELLTINTTRVQGLLNEFGDDVVEVSLAQGTVAINTVALLEEAYPSEYADGLNGLQPNTNPLLNEQRVLDVLVQRLGSTLEALLTALEDALRDTVTNAETTVKLEIPIQRCELGLAVACALAPHRWVDIGGLGITISASVGELFGGTVEEDDIDVDTSILNKIPLIGNLLGNITEGIVTGLGKEVIPAIGTILKTTLTSVATLPSNLLETEGTPIVNLVGGLYEGLFLKEILAITINAQNDPEVGGEQPQDWRIMKDGRYDVAALRVGVLDALEENGVWLYLGRGSVGPVCSTADLSTTCAEY